MFFCLTHGISNTKNEKRNIIFESLTFNLDRNPGKGLEHQPRLYLPASLPGLDQCQHPSNQTPAQYHLVYRDWDYRLTHTTHQNEISSVSLRKKREDWWKHKAMLRASVSSDYIVTVNSTHVKICLRSALDSRDNSSPNCYKLCRYHLASLHNDIFKCIMGQNSLFS